MIKYKNIAHLMRENNLTTYDVLKNRLISQSVMQRLRTNAPINTTTIGHLCRVLHCQPGDFLEYVEEPED